MKLNEIMVLLTQPVPRNMIEILEKGNTKIPFISWINLCELLDQRVAPGNWSWEIKECFSTGDRLTIIGQVSIIGEDRTLVMQATGSEQVDKEFFGDANTNAEAKAFRRCLSKLGLGRSLSFRSKEDKKIGVDYTDKADWISRKISQQVRLGYSFEYVKAIASKAKDENEFISLCKSQRLSGS